MVRMVPEWYADDFNSSAEAKLFRKFEKYTTSDSIYVLHSLALKDHITNVFGEVDFVIVCPRGVLCMEVKGGDVYRDNGVWYFENRYGKKDHNTKGPFKQVQGNAQSLRKSVDEWFPKSSPLHGLQFACCVMTPDSTITENDTEIIQEILFDENFTGDLGDVISRSFDYWENKLNDKHGFTGKSLSDKGVKDLASRLRGDFRIVPSMKKQYDEYKKQLIVLTDEQYQVLENHRKIKRNFVEGCAGTGKTILAMEQCRRKTLEGDRVLFLCFNHNLAYRVREIQKDEDVRFEVWTLHGLLKHLCGEDESRDNSSAYYDSLISRFLAMDTPDQYDLLVVDEGQDLLKGKYVACMDRLLKGGMTKGRWTIYYDPNQNVYGENEELESVLEEYEEISAPWTLSVNCRNTKRIAGVNYSLTGFDQASNNRVEGKKPVWRTYKNLEDEYDQLVQDLRRLKKEGVDNSQIVLLSPYPEKSSKCCLFYDDGSLEELGVLNKTKPWIEKKKEYRFSTIRTFKGLEADVIMLLDTDGFRDTEKRKQNYVGISRARTDLYIYYPEELVDEKDDVVGENSEKKKR